MSLLSSASPWTNDEDASKKRIPTIRKTMKKMGGDQAQGQGQSILGQGRETDKATTNMSLGQGQAQQTQSQQVPTNMSLGPVQPVNMSNYTDYSTIDTAQSSSMHTMLAEQDARTSRVNQLLNQMSAYGAENAGQGLANFQPLSHPVIQKRTDTETPVTGREGDPVLGALPNPLQIPPPEFRSNQSNFSAHGQDLGNVSHYNVAYMPPTNSLGPPIGVAAAMSSAPLDTKLMEKINYMIHLLEQQHNEKTSNITEEFILYTFLGVFIIFIVDSFARAGKYIR